LSEHPGADQERVLDCLADAVVAVDLQGRITLLNRAAEALAGLPSEQARGRLCREVLKADDHAVERLLLQAALGQGPALNKGLYLLTGEGLRLPASLTVSALEDTHGQVVGAVGILRDLTDVFEGYLAGTAGDPRADLRKALLRLDSYAGIISRNHEMREIFAVLPEIARSDATVLIQGASGSGKELFARALHQLGPRSEGPLVILNCGALPDSLLESELFGYKAGAFTDARQDKPGRFAQAHGGTLFLDEIGDISPAMQVRLLRVLQEREVMPLGGTRAEATDVRVIAATHRDLYRLMLAGRFREDLFYRLDVVRLRIPPLCRRSEDIPLLADHCIARLRRRHRKEIGGLSAEALALLQRYDFPGNVRELENALEHAFVLCSGAVIEPRHLPMRLRQQAEQAESPAVSSLAELESRFLRQVLERNDNSAGAAARELGIHRSTLWRRMKRLGMARS